MASRKTKNNDYSFMASSPKKTKPEGGAMRSAGRARTLATEKSVAEANLKVEQARNTLRYRQRIASGNSVSRVQPLLDKRVKEARSKLAKTKQKYGSGMMTTAGRQAGTKARTNRIIGEYINVYGEAAFGGGATYAGGTRTRGSKAATPKKSSRRGKTR